MRHLNMSPVSAIAAALCCMLAWSHAEAQPARGKLAVKRSGQARVLARGDNVLSAPYHKLKPLGPTGAYVGLTKSPSPMARFRDGFMEPWRIVRADGTSPGLGYDKLTYAAKAKVVIGKRRLPGTDDRCLRKVWTVVDGKTGYPAASKARSDGTVRHLAAPSFLKIRETRSGRLIGKDSVSYYRSEINWRQKGETLLDNKGRPLHDKPYKRIQEHRDGSLTAVRLDGMLVRLAADGKEQAPIVTP